MEKPDIKTFKYKNFKGYGWHNYSVEQDEYIRQLQEEVMYLKHQFRILETKTESSDAVISEYFTGEDLNEINRIMQDEYNTRLAKKGYHPHTVHIIS